MRGPSSNRLTSSRRGRHEARAILASAVDSLLGVDSSLGRLIINPVRTRSCGLYSIDRDQHASNRQSGPELEVLSA